MRLLGRAVVLALGLGVALAPVAVEAQATRKVYRIGVLELVPMGANAANLAAFRQGLGELGYVEGQDVVIEYRSADGRTERFVDLATGLVRLNVDLIVTRGTAAALAAKQATSTIPIVMASSGAPADEGVVASLARPGGNVTGLHAIAPAELGGKRLRLLKEMMPGLSRVAFLWDAGDLYALLMMREAEKVARALGVQLKSVEVRRTGYPEGAFEEMLLGQGRVDALIAVEGYLTFADRTRIVGFAAMGRLPAIYGLREFVEAGGLVAYGTDRRDLYRRSATYVHRILNGANPGDLPVEAPTKFELVINLKAARALGLTIPRTLLLRADQVIE